MSENYERGKHVRNYISLVLYLAGGWRSYQEISDELGWDTEQTDGHHRSAARNVRALEEAGIPVEWSEPPDKLGGGGVTRRMRLPPDWVARTPWLRRYIIVKDLPRQGQHFERSLSK